MMTGKYAWGIILFHFNKQKKCNVKTATKYSQY